jgi:hypothetical protein
MLKILTEDKIPSRHFETIFTSPTILSMFARFDDLGICSEDYSRLEEVSSERNFETKSPAIFGP